MRFHEELEQKKLYVDGLIDKRLRKSEGYASTIIDAVNYSLKVGGKRIRPILLLETNKMFAGGMLEEAKTIAVALEMIHTYSLVHDDLPAMDDDDLRRGHPTTHARYGEALGILTGDALLNESMEIALSAIVKSEDKERVSRAVSLLYRKAGIDGMIGGQAADVLAEKRNEFIEEDKLKFIYINKTSALIEASMMAGAILAPDASESDISAVERAASAIGMAFQIRDDILDVSGDEKKLGKNIGSDEKNAKSTYVTFAGMEGAKEHVAKLSDEAQRILLRYADEDSFLLKLIDYLADRDN